MCYVLSFEISRLVICNIEKKIPCLVAAVPHSQITHKTIQEIKIENFCLLKRKLPPSQCLTMFSVLKNVWKGHFAWQSVGHLGGGGVGLWLTCLLMQRQLAIEAWLRLGYFYILIKQNNWRSNCRHYCGDSSRSVSHRPCVQSRHLNIRSKKYTIFSLVNMSRKACEDMFSHLV